jgi:hypothetical protein
MVDVSDRRKRQVGAASADTEIEVNGKKKITSKAKGTGAVAISAGGRVTANIQRRGPTAVAAGGAADVQLLPGEQLQIDITTTLAALDSKATGVNSNTKRVLIPYFRLLQAITPERGEILDLKNMVEDLWLKQTADKLGFNKNIGGGLVGKLLSSPVLSVLIEKGFLST